LRELAKRRKPCFRGYQNRHRSGRHVSRACRRRPTSARAAFGHVGARIPLRRHAQGRTAQQCDPTCHDPF
jgi:hypothetical protein